MFRLRNNVSYIIYWTVLHQINKAIKSRVISIHTPKNKKLKIQCQRQHHNKESDHCNNYLKYVNFNMPWYQLSHDTYTALSFGLDHHIPLKTILFAKLKLILQLSIMFSNNESMFKAKVLLAWCTKSCSNITPIREGSHSQLPI